MPEKLYRRLVALVLALGMLTTTALVAYTAYLHNHVSPTSKCTNSSS